MAIAQSRYIIAGFNNYLCDEKDVVEIADDYSLQVKDVVLLETGVMNHKTHKTHHATGFDAVGKRNPLGDTLSVSAIEGVQLWRPMTHRVVRMSATENPFDKDNILVKAAIKIVDAAVHEKLKQGAALVFVPRITAYNGIWWISSVDAIIMTGDQYKNYRAKLSISKKAEDIPF